MTASPAPSGGSTSRRSPQFVAREAEQPARIITRQPVTAGGGVLPFRSVQLSFTAVARPDIGVRPGDLAASPALPQLGVPTTLTAIIRNSGLTQADSVQVVLSDETINAGIGVGYLTIAPRDSATFAASWTATMAGEHRIQIRVSMPTAAPEGDPSNNQAELVLPVLENDPTTEVDATLPAQFALGPPTPNPFRATVGFLLALPRAAHVRVLVYDVRGGLVKRLIDRTLPAGRHAYSWNGTNDRGARVGASVYFVRFSVPGMELTKKTVLLR
ncbi:MAG: hypothetical protein HYZ09_04015 [Candidatus Kerfeldbacteria bacterium]|nr:hypothetical protein [Candidatus Kerfeldbacteria bacterium]